MTALIAVGQYIISEGPVVKTCDAGKIYKEQKGLSSGRNSVELYEVFSKHLNLSQVYLFGRAYFIQTSHFSSIDVVMKTLKSIANKDDIVREVAKEALSDHFVSSLQYLDSARNRRVVKTLLSQITSVRFTTKLQGIQSRRGTTPEKKIFILHLLSTKAFALLVRNDMTNIQQYKLTEQIVFKGKMKEIVVGREGN